MVLSYSFRSKVTSGYFKATSKYFETNSRYSKKTSSHLKADDSLDSKMILQRLVSCSRPASHPLLLPVIILDIEVVSKNDKNQRKAREDIREIEKNLSNRYASPAANGYEQAAPSSLDEVNTQLAQGQCDALWQRPQSWLNVVNRLTKAMHAFWEELPPEDRLPELQKLHCTLLSRLDFIGVKLEALEHYTNVTLERFHIQREVVSKSPNCNPMLLSSTKGLGRYIDELLHRSEGVETCHRDCDSAECLGAS